MNLIKNKMFRNNIEMFDVEITITENYFNKIDDDYNRKVFDEIYDVLNEALMKSEKLKMIYRESGPFGDDDTKEPFHTTITYNVINK